MGGITVIYHEKPIIALCTPKGAGAIALIRISGDCAIELVDTFAKLSSGKKLADQKSHTIHHGHIIDKTSIIDEVLFLVMKTPRTFTGEDTVEISCHNNTFIINQIVQLAIRQGAHQAGRGEFTKRAFLNKKIDLLKAEAINDLISAQTELALKKSMAQLKGTLSSKITAIENDILSLATTVEASFEFLDEEQKDVDFDTIIRKKINQLLKKTSVTLQNFSQQKQIREGIKISLIGNVNVGKSTLFNAIVAQDRAIVTSTPGTTRDAIETSLYQNGHFWLVIDTAGLRTTNDTIEQKGIDRSWQQAAKSDIILLIFDATKELSQEETKIYKTIYKKHPEKCIMVLNKIDALTQNHANKNHTNKKEFESNACIAISAKENIGIQKLKLTIEEKIKTILTNAQSPFLLNERQYNLIAELDRNLKSLALETTNTIHYELVAYELHDALKLTTQLTGKTITDKMMDAVFKTFCVGK